MRMMPSRYLMPKPAQIKRQVSQVAHVSAPLKGLSQSSKLTPGDPLTATILRNFVVDDDRISARAGYVKQATVAGAKPIERLVPFYGQPQRLAAATNNTLANAADATLLKGGFTGNDWSWTAFSNLSQVDYTVMVNGKDGVWSWDGGLLAAGIVKEAVTAPAGSTWIVPDQFNIVLSHMNRLWFADSSNLAVYYLPLQTKSGEVKVLPLNAMFKRGGSIRAMATWTLDGGAGLNDQLVIFSTNGECVIYAGTDPDTNFNLTGIFRFDAPMSKHCVINYGGELYLLISTGVVPMSTLLRAETEQLGQSEKSVLSLFLAQSTLRRDQPGWQLMLNPSSGRLICNMPLGAANQYEQMIRHMPRTVWSQWTDMPARCWGWIDPYVYFGDDLGAIYRMHPQYLNDDGAPITIDVQMAWSQFKTPAIKQFKMLQPYLITSGDPQLTLDVMVDYDYNAPFNTPDITFSAQGSDWDAADWDVADWAVGEATVVTLQTGVGQKGKVGAPRLVARIMNCTFALSGWDVIYEQGAILG